MKQKTRCSALDVHGNRCGARNDVMRTSYHGDPALTGEDWPSWVIVGLCPRHRKSWTEPHKQPARKGKP